MRHLVSIVVVSAAFATPAAHAGPAASLEPYGLEGRVVTSLGVYGSLYAGTIGDGVFRRNLADPDSDWVSLGLTGKKIRAIYPHKFGPLGFATTAGIESDHTMVDSARVYCSTFDQPNWAPTDLGMPRGQVTAVWSLDGFPDPTICGETFAATIGSAGQVWRRGFNKNTWEKVLDLGFGVANVVRADQKSGNVWAGGENTVFAPWIARSADRGETWHVAYPDLAGDNACDALAIHPDDPDAAYAGMEGAVIVTKDGGVTWNYTGLRDAPAYMYGLALDVADPAHILAGGMVANPNNWALWESLDGGETWEVIPAPVLAAAKRFSGAEGAGTPAGATVAGISSIVAHPKRAGTFFLSTFGHGVWIYERPTTGVEDRCSGKLPY